MEQCRYHGGGYLPRPIPFLRSALKTPEAQSMTDNTGSQRISVNEGVQHVFGLISPACDVCNILRAPLEQPGFHDLSYEALESAAGQGCPSCSLILSGISEFC